MTPQERILKHLTFLYGAQTAAEMWSRLELRLDDFRQRHPQLAQEKRPLSERLSQRDAILIAYADQVQEEGKAPLRSLAEFAGQYLDGVVSGIHILPFYPYSSDDGFSVIDYRQVKPEWGRWADVSRLGRTFRLMFDGVINHISQHSEWFAAFKRGQTPCCKYFLAVDPHTDLSMVVRPRALPLLTGVQTVEGAKWVWTTFSADQIDLDYHCPELMLEIIDLFLFYVEQGAELIRLDAIAYLWKEIGTTCIHLPQTHAVVKLLRAVLDLAAPGVMMITETNVPHAENISYFGDPLPSGGTDEAQLVYQFPLAPLILHSILTGDATVLSRWADGLDIPPGVTFFNFTASHDGIGVRPAEGLLSKAEIQALADAVLAHGGRVSYKANADGSASPYELNISYIDALSDPASDEPLSAQGDRFVVSQAIMLALAGVPGIYVHSLFGSRSWVEGMQQSGQNRTINRQKFERAALERELGDLASLRAQVFGAYKKLLQARASEPAFHPFGAQQVLTPDRRVFALLRTAPDDQSRVLCLHNVSGETLSAECSLIRAGWRDLLSGETGTSHIVKLAPFAVRWLMIE
ncbi:MAG: sugar phosphorylase [Anaerolineae bacterium]|nr:sugar phosphorylase [Anaerolineae bacterium]